MSVGIRLLTNFRGSCLAIDSFLFVVAFVLFLVGLARVGFWVFLVVSEGFGFYVRGDLGRLFGYRVIVVFVWRLRRV